MTLAHILGEGSTDEIVLSVLILLGLIMLLRRSERKARRRFQERQEATGGESP